MRSRRGGFIHYNNDNTVMEFEKHIPRGDFVHGSLFLYPDKISLKIGTHKGCPYKLIRKKSYYPFTSLSVL